MIFARSLLFNGDVIPISPDNYYRSTKAWEVQSKYRMATFSEVKFLFASNHSILDVTAISADCDKF